MSSMQLWQNYNLRIRSAMESVLVFEILNSSFQWSVSLVTYKQNLRGREYGKQREKYLKLTMENVWETETEVLIELKFAVKLHLLRYHFWEKKILSLRLHVKIKKENYVCVNLFHLINNFLEKITRQFERFYTLHVLNKVILTLNLLKYMT